jgi:hypothetical protein
VAAVRRRWKLGAAALVVGAMAALALFGAAGSPSKAAARKGGVVRSASSAIELDAGVVHEPDRRGGALRRLVAARQQPARRPGFTRDPDQVA